MKTVHREFHSIAGTVSSVTASPEAPLCLRYSLRKSARLVFAAFALAAGLLGARLAEAEQLITFDDFVATPIGNGSADPVRSVTSGGFNFTALGFHIIVNPSLCGLGGCVSNGTQYATSDIPNSSSNPTRGGPVTMSRDGGGTFSLLSFDGAELLIDFYAAVLAAEPISTGISVIGNQMGGGTLSAGFALDWVMDGAGGLPDFQTFQFGSEWINLTSVVWKSGDLTPKNMAFDNIVVSISPIPEPETYAMLLAGLGLLGFAARRRKQKEAAFA